MKLFTLFGLLSVLILCLSVFSTEGRDSRKHRRIKLRPDVAGQQKRRHCRSCNHPKVIPLPPRKAGPLPQS